VSSGVRFYGVVDSPVTNTNYKLLGEKMKKKLNCQIACNPRMAVNFFFFFFFLERFVFIEYVCNFVHDIDTCKFIIEYVGSICGSYIFNNDFFFFFKKNYEQMMCRRMTPKLSHFFFFNNNKFVIILYCTHTQMNCEST